MEARAFRSADPAEQVFGRERVHEETDGAAIHPVDRGPLGHEAMDRLEHEPVAAEGHDHVLVRDGLRLVDRFELGEGGLRLLRPRRDEAHVFGVGERPLGGLRCFAVGAHVG